MRLVEPFSFMSRAVFITCYSLSFYVFTELSEDSEIGLCSYDMMLPDSATVYGRLFLGAWDAGLDSVADETVNLMLHATEVVECYHKFFPVL